MSRAKTGRKGHAYRHHADDDTGLEDRGDEKRRENGGEALHGVHQPHEGLVQPAAEVAGEHAEKDAQPHPDADSDDADHDGGLGADHDAREEIPTELVGAQWMGLRGALEPGLHGHFQRVTRRIAQAHGRRQQEERRDGEAGGEGDVPERAGRDPYS